MTKQHPFEIVYDIAFVLLVTCALCFILAMFWKVIVHG